MRGGISGPAWRWALAGATTFALLVGLGFRLWHAARDPLWLDEAYSAYAASHGLGFLWHVVPRYETHPPFYYTLLWAWTQPFGDGLAALRALGIVAFAATLPLVALAARDLARIAGVRMPAAVAAMLAVVALHPLLIEMARQVRPYPVMILAYAAALAALARFARCRLDGGSFARTPFLLYLVAIEAVLWLHNLGPLFAAPLGLGCLAILVARPAGRGPWLWFVGGHLAVVIVWLPALAILADQAPAWASATWLRFVWGTALARAPLLWVGADPLAWVAGAALALLGALRLWRAGRALLVLLLGAAILPVIVSLLVSAWITPIFLLRTLTPVAVPALLLIAVGVAGGTAGWDRWLRGALLVAMCGAMASTDVANRRRGPQENWYPVIRWLAARYRPGDVILAYPNEGALPFDRAVRDLGLDLPSRPVPGPVPTLAPPPGSWYVSGSRGVPSLDRAHLEAIASAPAVIRAPTVWLLRVGPWAYDKGDVLLHALERDRVETSKLRSKTIDLRGLAQIRQNVGRAGQNPG